jgi:hypothetical protein
MQEPRLATYKQSEPYSDLRYSINQAGSYPR